MTDFYVYFVYWTSPLAPGSFACDFVHFTKSCISQCCQLQGYPTEFAYFGTANASFLNVPFI